MMEVERRMADGLEAGHWRFGGFGLMGWGEE